MSLISVDEAFSRLITLFSRLETETVPLMESCGRVLAEDVVADRAQPPFAASAMDGYAVRRSDILTDARLRLVGTSAAGVGFSGRVNDGEAVRIFTGAPVPDGADMILIQEDARSDGAIVVVGDTRDTADYIRPAGGDFIKGARLTAPRRLNARDIALAASMNQPALTVFRKPVVAIMPTGDELVWPGEMPRQDQIISSNNFGTAALLKAAGAEIRMMPIAGDSLAGLDQVFRLAKAADAVVTLGGASVGDHDLVQESAIKNGLELEFYSVAMRPGKPLMAGRFGSKPLVGLPGNPVSAMVCARLFLVPAVEALQGLGGARPTLQSAVLECDLPKNGRREHYMRAQVNSDRTGWTCRPFERQDSSLLTVLAESNALMMRPASDAPRKKGANVDFLWL